MIKNYAVILSGGVGTRMKLGDFPKQYVEIDGKPVIIFSMEIFEKNRNIDGIFVVASEMWQERIRGWIDRYGISKFMGFAPAGRTRQHSVINGLNAAMCVSENEADRVVIHDAARPLVTEELISNCLDALDEYDGCLPVIPVKDTVYASADGVSVSGLPDRSTLFAGQAPESFRLHEYARLNEKLGDEEIEKVTGTSAIAVKNGMRVKLIPGDENNFKLTTPLDLERFERIIKEKK